eukprot:g4535.t1
MNPTPTPQIGSGGGYAFISPGTANSQTSLSNLRQQGLQILQTDSAAQVKAQQQQQQQQTTPTQQSAQQRMHTTQLQGLTGQSLQYLSNTGPASAQYSSNVPALGAIQIIPQKTNTQTFQQGQTLQTTGQGLQNLQGVPAAAASLQTQQAMQSLQNLQALPGFQNVPGVQVLQQYPGYGTQMTTTTTQQKPGGTGFQSMNQGQSMQNFPRNDGRQIGGSGGGNSSLFSNSNQRGGFNQSVPNWGDRGGDFRGRIRDRSRRDDKGMGGNRPMGRDGFLQRMNRDREPFRRDRGRDRFDRGFRDFHRRETTGFSKDRERRSPGRFHDFKKEENLKEQTKRDLPAPPKSMDSNKDHNKAASHSVTPSRTSAEYTVKVPQVPFGTYERDYSDIARRYTHLYVSPDFTKMVCRWVKATNSVRHPYGCTLCPLNRPVQLEIVQAVHESETEIALPAAKNTFEMPLRWNAKCTFLCGLENKAYLDILKGKFDGGTHLLNALKFVTVREEKDKKKTGIMCLGGPYDPSLDGGNPHVEIECLKRACIRHVNEQVLLDLSPCNTWTRFCDIHYQRSDASGYEYAEITVIFLVDISELVPSLDNWPLVWKEQQEWKDSQLKTEETQQKINDPTPDGNQEKTENKDHEMEDTNKSQEAPGDSLQEPEAPLASPIDQNDEIPTEPSLLLKCRSAKNGKVKAMAISLDGLLDYDETDKDEATFELSLFAESFNELLMRDYGKLVLNSLIEYKESKQEKKLEEKRSRSVEHEDHEPVVKKPKQAETPGDMESIKEETGVDPANATEEGVPVSTEAMEEVQYQDSPAEGIITTEVETSVPVVEEIEDSEMSKDVVEDIVMKENEAVDDDDDKKHEVVVNEELLFAFRYFDRAGCGYIKCDDMRRLLHNLGSCLAPRVVRELVHGAAAIGKEKHKFDRVYYKYFTDKESSK